MKVDTKGVNSDFVVECVQPFAAYQIITGPIDSVGYYFRCKAQGQLLEMGDETTNIKWINVKNLKSLMNDNPLQFSDVDRAGIKYYLKYIEKLGGVY